MAEVKRCPECRGEIDHAETGDKTPVQRTKTKWYHRECLELMERKRLRAWQNDRAVVTSGRVIRSNGGLIR